MQNDRKIVSARITKMPRSFLDTMPEVHATLQDGTEQLLFSYNPDEISFHPSEFVGLTIAQANRLQHDKEIAYLHP